MKKETFRKVPSLYVYSQQLCGSFQIDHNLLELATPYSAVLSDIFFGGHKFEKILIDLVDRFGRNRKVAEAQLNALQVNFALSLFLT